MKKKILICGISVIGVFAVSLAVFTLTRPQSTDVADGLLFPEDGTPAYVSEVGDIMDGDGGLLSIFDAGVPLNGSTEAEDPALRQFILDAIELTNRERTKAGLAPLSESEPLRMASAVRARELVTLFSHNRPDGSLCFSIFGEFNVESKARSENIAGNFKTPDKVVQAWMGSEGHRANIMNPAYNQIGIGLSKDQAGKLNWVQLFTD